MTIPIANYTPSPAARHGVATGGYEIALDIAHYADLSGSYSCLWLVQKNGAAWDFVGNLAPADPQYGNAGKIWEINEYTTDGNGTFLEQANRDKEALLFNALAKIALILKNVFGAGAQPAPVPGAWPATTTDAARQNIAQALYDHVTWDAASNSYVQK